MKEEEEEDEKEEKGIRKLVYTIQQERVGVFILIPSVVVVGDMTAR